MTSNLGVSTAGDCALVLIGCPQKQVDRLALDHTAVVLDRSGECENAASAVSSLSFRTRSGTIGRPHARLCRVEGRAARSPSGSAAMQSR